ncbi:phosphate signaling complex PhoU family protein [Mycobacterium sp. NPDC003323]
MRTEFHAQLDRLTAELGEMCALAGEAAADATTALIDADPQARGRVRQALRRLDVLNERVDRRAFSVLARHSPVAHDLRLVMSAFSIAANADRMGALAANIARFDGPVPEVTVPILARLGEHVVALAEHARRAVTGGDTDEAERVRLGDAAVNDLHRELLATVLNERWSAGIQAASDTALLGRFYERFADNAVEIARKVIFQEIGEVPLADNSSR